MGRLVPQLLGWGTNNVLVPNFLAEVGKKQDIHVLGSPLISAEATRMQDLAPEFSKIFLDNTPGPPQREGRPPPVSPPARPLAGRGAQAPGVGTQTLVPLNFSAVVAPLYLLSKTPYLSVT